MSPLVYDRSSRISSSFLFLSSFLLLSLIVKTSQAQVWQYIATMHFARQECSAVALTDGRILVAGGNDGGQSLNSSELYDRKTDTWKVTSPMHDARWRFTMILLKDGRVLAAGGLNDMGASTLNSCEIFDPASETWSLESPMLDPRENFVMLQLRDGRVFINGGLNANQPVYLSSTELFDPVANVHQLLSPMPIPYFGQASLYDTAGNKIIIQSGSNGGLGGVYPPTTQIYDLSKDSWRMGQDSYAAHDNSSFVDMPDGGLLCLGGRVSSYVAHDVVEVLRSPYQQWQKLGALTSPRWHGSVLNIGLDSVLVVGGNNDPGQYQTSYDSTNWFDYRNNSTSEGPRLNKARFFFSAVSAKFTDTARCQQIQIAYVCGGQSTGGQILNSCEQLTIPLHTSSNNLRLLLSDISDAIPGDTLSMPVRILLGKPVTSFGYHIHLSFNSDVLELLEPNYTNTISAGTKFDVINRSATGADIFVPDTVTLRSGATLLNLLFRPYVSVSQCTYVTIDKAEFSTNPKPTDCALSVSVDSAQVCVAKSCGDYSMRQVMLHQVPTLDNIQQSGNHLNVLYHSPYGSGAIDVFDVLGTHILSSNFQNESGVVRFDLSATPAGIYFIRMTTGGYVVTRRTILAR